MLYFILQFIRDNFNYKCLMGACGGMVKPERTIYRQNSANKPFLVSAIKSGIISQRPGKNMLESNSPPQRLMSKSKSNDIVPIKSHMQHSRNTSPNKKGDLKSSLHSRTVKPYTKPHTLKQDEQISRDPSKTIFMNMMPVFNSSMGAQNQAMKDSKGENCSIMRVDSLEDSIVMRKNMPPEVYNQQYQNQQLYQSPSEMKEIQEIFQTSQNQVYSGRKVAELEKYQFKSPQVCANYEDFVQNHRKSQIRRSPSDIFKEIFKEQQQNNGNNQGEMIGGPYAHKDYIEEKTEHYYGSKTNNPFHNSTVKKNLFDDNPQYQNDGKDNKKSRMEGSHISKAQAYLSLAHQQPHYSDRKNFFDQKQMDEFIQRQLERSERKTKVASIKPFNYNKHYQYQHGSNEMLRLVDDSVELPPYVSKLQNLKGEGVRCDNFENFDKLQEFKHPQFQRYIIDVQQKEKQNEEIC